MSKQKIKIPEGWKEVRINDVCTIVNGKTPSRSNSDFWENGTIPWFTIDDIRSQGKIINSTMQHVTELAVQSAGIRLVPKNSTLLCCTASVGECAFANIELATNQQFNALTVKDDNVLDPKFLFFFASTLSEQLRVLMGTTTFGFVSISKLGDIKFLLPPLHEQKKIAEILGVIEDKIDILKKIQNNFTQLKKGVMVDLLSGKKSAV